MPKVQKKKKAIERDPLEKQILEEKETGVLRTARNPAPIAPGVAAEVEEALPAKLSSKILEQAKLQQEELEDAEPAPVAKPLSVRTGKKKVTSARHEADSDEDEQEDLQEDMEDSELADLEPDAAEAAAAAGAGVLTEEEEKELEKWVDDVPVAQTRTLADLIMEKIREKQEQTAADAKGKMGAAASREEEEEVLRQQLPPKVVEVYTQVGMLLRTWSSGGVPKAFKVIPALQNWEQVLWLTTPEKWSNNAMFAATRLFAANLNPKLAQRFYNLVLLPRVREDISQHKRLNFHLFMALKKAVFKPAAFFKGIILPLAENGCSVREAIIIAAVLTRVSIPASHSAAAIYKITQLPFRPTSTLFLKSILNKKYNLPHKVVDALVKYFCTFSKKKGKQQQQEVAMEEEKEDRMSMAGGDGDEPAFVLGKNKSLPVIWHQTLLVFSQRYKNALSPEQKESLKALLRVQQHPQITPEIRRELFGISAAASSASAAAAASSSLPVLSSFPSAAVSAFSFPLPSVNASAVLASSGSAAAAPAGRDVDMSS